MNKLIPKSHFAGKPSNVDSVEARKRIEQSGKVNLSLLARFEDCWKDWAEFRSTRLRNLRYVRGDQWADYVWDEKGRRVLERDRIAKRTGGIVLQNNHLIKIVNTLTGLYAKTATKPVCFARQADADAKSQMMTSALQTSWDNNQMPDVLISEMFEMIVGGMAVSKELWQFEDEKGVDDSYTYFVDPGHFCAEMEGTDPRHWDVSMIGEIVDYELGELASKLAHSEYDFRQLEEIYSAELADYRSHGERRRSDYHEDSFNTPMQNNWCRVYEIWTKEHKPRYRCTDVMDLQNPMYRIEVDELELVKEENLSRVEIAVEQGMIDADQGIMLSDIIRRSKKVPADTEVPLIETQYIIDEYWHYQALAPDGRILEEYDSPYEHGSHPYTFKLYLYANGQVTPFISPVIDQQRYINRLISLNDMLINSSIKGLKMIPKQAVPDGMSNKQFAEHALEIGGWIFYDAEKLAKYPNAKLDVITNNATNIGIGELLQIEMASVNEITAVSDALQGKAPSAGTAASRYMMETQNSTTSISALMSKFATYENEVARKKMKVIHQYYEDGRHISSSRTNGYAEYGEFHPQEVQDIEFDVAIKESVDSPVSRMINNQTLEQWAANGWIGLRELLDYGYYPNLDELKQRIATNQEAMAAQGASPQQPVAPTMDAAGIPTAPRADGQNPHAANPAVVQQLQQILRQ